MEDDIDGIWDAMKESARLFKFGSGVGADWSKLRSSKERVSGGGTASGPVSFMRVQDATGATIKSGGKTRRAAIMQILRADHPDIWDFVNVKAEEEKKAHALIEQGYDASFNGEAYQTADFQDVNQSVRIDDDFFELVEGDDHINYGVHAVTDGTMLDQYDPDDLLEAIAENTHQCGDPGIQYDGEIQKMHTTKNSGRINGSNPCSEFLYLDNTACNLASLNLRKFEHEYSDGWDQEKIAKASEVMFTAQDILCDFAGYPSEDIAEMSEKHRPLGLGFANLGATLMAHGIPYNSDEGRAVAAALQSVIHFAAYNRSTQMAKELRPFAAFEDNDTVFHDVMAEHRNQLAAMIGREHHLSGHLEITDEVKDIMDYAYALSERMEGRGRRHGYRNSQATVIAPTGTISFFMGCTTTGIEPSPALVQYKNLAGEDDSQIKIVNDVVEEALLSMGYDRDAVELVEEYIKDEDTIEGVNPLLREWGFKPLSEEEMAVFDCAMPPANGERSIHHMGHINMMAAVQPFVSGAISKTVNMPSDATVEDIKNAYIEGWKKRLKALASYRDGSKQSQPVSTTDGSEEDESDEVSDENPSSASSEAPDIHEGMKDEAFQEGVKQADALGFLAAQLEDDKISLKKILDYLGDGVTLRKLVEAAVEYSDYEEIAAIFETMAGEEVSGHEHMMDLAAVGNQFNEYNVAIETIKEALDDGAIGPLDVIDQLDLGLGNTSGDGVNRRKLPDQAPSVRKKFRVGNVEGYIHVGLYPDTRKPGEVFITVSKEGSTLAGVMDSFATALSLALQYGVPLEDLVEKFKNQRFEPSGFTGDDIQSATSIVDYVAQWMEQHFLKTQETVPPSDEDFSAPVNTENDSDFGWAEEDYGEHPLDPEGQGSDETHRDTSDDNSSGKVCHNCGSQMQQDGTCYVCPVCGEDTGCGG